MSGVNIINDLGKLPDSKHDAVAQEKLAMEMPLAVGDTRADPARIESGFVDSQGRTASFDGYPYTLPARKNGND